MNGVVFSIEEFSVYDGPGIRTSVFLKGCPLRCNWCHNPEGQNSNIEIVKSPNGCIHCGNCSKYTIEKNGNFYLTKESIDNCPMGLIRYCGEVISSVNLCEKLLKNSFFLNNGGGVTFSGGEPFMQSAFLFECLDILKGNIHTAVQTCGYCKENIFAQSMDKADYYLYDLKIIDAKDHFKYTGVYNTDIIKNFITLAHSGKQFVVRIPLIPGVTDTEKNIQNIISLLKENHVSYAELLPYNKMAGGKYKMLMRNYKPAFMENIECCIHKEMFAKNNIKIKVL